MKKILFYGVCGASMSALAVLSSLENEVWGYDDFPHDTKILEQHKIKLLYKVDEKALLEFDEIIYTNAIFRASQLVNWAHKHHKIIIERAEYLAQFSKNYENIIAVSGTHGKTTTTAMIGSIFSAAGLKPSVHVGGQVNDWQANFLLGEKKYFITEACEFNKSFLHLRPDISVITNIEPEHLDTYHTLTNEQLAYMQFAKQSKKVFSCESVDIPSIHFGFNHENAVYAQNITQENGKFSFECVINNTRTGRIELNVMGKHNVENALASITVAHEVGIDFPTIKSGLEKFNGVKRRLTKIAQGQWGTHFLDYAHHPTEIKASLNTLRLLPHKRLIAIFQPHTYSRTKLLMKEFASCFNCNELYLLPTYPAREQYLQGGDSLDLFYNLVNTNCKYFSNEQSLFYDLYQNLCAFDIVVWLGAGSVDKICKNFFKAKEKE